MYYIAKAAGTLPIQLGRTESRQDLSPVKGWYAVDVEGMSKIPRVTWRRISPLL